MPADREAPTLADYAVTAISPVLIMLMVGSLVFFLVEVLYAGKYSGKLLYSLFFFVIGAVLVARISIQIDGARATLYGVGLGVVTFLAMMAYVEYPAGTPLRSVAWLVNLGLMGVVWWSAHKLTWDCTHIDEKREASGRGVLAAAGLDADTRDSGSESESGSNDKTGPARRESQTSANEPPRGKKKKKKKRRESALWTWIERYKKYRAEQREKPHTPGVWVVYFSLAALPLFALGQSLVSPDDDARRRAIFLQMAVYVGSGLGLLVTTSLLGLRRYLRQRKAKIPAALTASWLGLGAALIAVFLVLGAFLPRPHSEVPWFGIARAGKSDREASRYAQSRDSAGKGEGTAGDVTSKGEGNASGKGGEPGGGKGEKGSGGKGQGKGSGGKDGKGGGSKGKSGGESGEGKNRDNSSEQGGKEESGRGGDTDREGDEAKGESGQRSGSQSGSPPQGLASALEKVGGFLKWVVFAVIAFLVLAAVVLGVLKYLAPFTEWARNLLDAIRNWWASLFGGRASRTREEAAAVAERGPVRPPPFSAFSNPFEDGTASGREPAELVVYTFAALDSWAWDRGHGRHATETPLEFAARLADEFPGRGAVIQQLAHLYARVAYSTAPLPANARATLEAVWDELVHGAAEPEVVAEV
jgi:hypothetical protein